MKRWLAAGILAVIVSGSNTLASMVTLHGALKSQGNKIIGSASKQSVQLAGPSLYWTLWGGQKFYNSNVVAAVANNWNASLIRAAIGVENGGYLDKPDQQTTYAKTIVDAAIASGIYVLVDWHDHNANRHIPEAKKFFSEMASTYKDTPNVIWEIWNEPDADSGTGTGGADTWNDIRSYADSIIPIIRAHSKNLIIVGTPKWSSDPLSAANNPLNDSNVAYTLHFYAGTHGAAVRDAAESALNKGIAIFITEFGTTDASGGKTDSTLYLDQAKTWLDWADNKGISWANWSLSNIKEPCSILLPKADVNGNWPDSVISASGRWIKQRLLARPSASDTDSVSILLTTTGKGSVTSVPSSLRIKKGTSITFTAVPSEGWTFKSWSSGVTATENPLIRTLTENFSLVANFVPDAGTNMLKNGDFSDSSENWSSWVDTSGAATISYANSSLSMTILKADTINWHMQVVQKELTLDSGCTYTITFDAWSGGERAIFVGLSTDKTWHFQGGSSLNLSSIKKTFTFTITPDSSTSAGVFQINFGADSLPVYVDNIVMYKSASISTTPRVAIHHQTVPFIFNRNENRIYWKPLSLNTRAMLTDINGRVINSAVASPLQFTGIRSGIYLFVINDGTRIQAYRILK
jgi:endoglucanase